MSMHQLSPLATDFYQFTMSQGYWRKGMHDIPAVFHLFFRTAPFQQPYAIAAGLQTIIEFVENWRLDDQHLAYLADIKQHDKPVFSMDFLRELKQLRFSGNLHAIPEGSLVFANEPLLRLEVPLWLGQLLETPLLNIINFQTLIASKAAQLCLVTQGKQPVYDFGLRRAQGPNGGLMGSRAAYIGGVAATSNVLAGKTYGIPVMGTHAHSWVSAFDNELDAFRAYAELYPEDCVLLVDTYHTLNGVKNAITVGLELKKKGYVLRGIRLDSGDLLALSQTARHLLDEAGLSETKILASNSLNEKSISLLIQARAPIDAWGVGTQLITAYDEPALNGVYKLSALYQQSHWNYKMKCSDEAEKVSMPGRHQVRRYHTTENYLHHDVIYDVDLGVQPVRSDSSMIHQDILQPIFQNGTCVYSSPRIQNIQTFAQHSLNAFDPEHTARQATYDQGLLELQKKILRDL